MTTGRIRNRLRSDAGFGLIEITVSMLMLAALAVMFLPVLMQGLRQAAENTTLATATQLVNERLRLAQAASPVCADVTALAGEAEFTDPRDVPIRVTTTVGECPAEVGTVAVTIEAVRTDTGRMLSRADSLVFVG